MKKKLILLALSSLVMGGASYSLSSVNPFTKGHGITVAAAVYKEQETRKLDQEGSDNPLPMNLREQQFRRMGDLIKARPVLRTQIREIPVIADQKNTFNTEALLQRKQALKAVAPKGKNGNGYGNLSPGDESEPTDMINGD